MQMSLTQCVCVCVHAFLFSLQFWQNVFFQGPAGPQGPIGYPGPRGVKVRCLFQTKNKCISALIDSKRLNYWSFNGNDLLRICSQEEASRSVEFVAKVVTETSHQTPLCTSNTNSELRSVWGARLFSCLPSTDVELKKSHQITLRKNVWLIPLLQDNTTGLASCQQFQWHEWKVLSEGFVKFNLCVFCGTSYEKKWLDEVDLFCR